MESNIKKLNPSNQLTENQAEYVATILEIFDELVARRKEENEQ